MHDCALRSHDYVKAGWKRGGEFAQDRPQAAMRHVYTQMLSNGIHDSDCCFAKTRSDWHVRGAHSFCKGCAGGWAPVHGLAAPVDVASSHHAGKHAQLGSLVLPAQRSGRAGPHSPQIPYLQAVLTTLETGEAASANAIPLCLLLKSDRCPAASLAS